MKFIDLFAGIGAFRKAAEREGHTCVGWVEWDLFARKSYEAIHDTNGEWTAHDIRTVDYRTMPAADIWTFGFPCQDISRAKSDAAGFDGKRSSLFFAVTRLLRQIQEWNPGRLPSYIIAENVEDFLTINGGWDFLKAQIELDEIGFNCEWDVLDASDYGTPQGRKRVFVVGHLRDRSTRKVFPIPSDEKRTYGKLKFAGRLPMKGPDKIKRYYYPDGICPTLTAMSGGHHEPKVIIDGRVRKLTEKEMWRAQGFTDVDFQKAKDAGVSNTQLKKQAGNSIAINTAHAIIKRMKLIP